MDEQRQNLKRVEESLDTIVMDFLRGVAKLSPPTFFLNELTRYVQRQTNSAGDSASRILRSLRQRKHCDYAVINRAKSLYELKSVKEFS